MADVKSSAVQASQPSMKREKSTLLGVIVSSSLFKIGGFIAALSLLGFLVPYISDPGTSLFSFVPEFPIPDYALPIPLFSTTPSPKTTPSPDTEAEPAAFVCDEDHTYRTEIVSTSPLVIYIHSLLTPTEVRALLRAGEAQFAPSRVDKPSGGRQQTPDRTSSSAGLPRDDPAVRCVLERARRFMGSMLTDGRDEMGPPQLVRYTRGQRFNLHNDWWDAPQWARDGSARRWNRVASFFVGLEDRCAGGETWFPFVEGGAGQLGEVGGAGEGEKLKGGDEEEDMNRQWNGDEPVWRAHPKGGVAFRPIAGNAVFWVNLHANGTGDIRTKHAGLPIGEGVKTAMNIWPRKYFPA